MGKHIVEWLRNKASFEDVTGWNDSAQHCREAADEIERLRAEVERLQSGIRQEAVERLMP